MIDFWKFFIDRKQFTILLVIALVAAGTVALNDIPKESAPEVRIPVGIVTTFYPGATSKDVESQVTNELERAASTLSAIDKINSTSKDSLSIITVQFRSNADLDTSIQKLKDVISTAQPKLPKDAEDSIVSDVNFADQPILIVSIAGDLLPISLTELGDTLKDDLSTLEGVSRIEVTGTQPRQVQVVADGARLAQYSLSVLDISNALASSNSTLPVGTIVTENVKYPVAFKGALADPSEVGLIAIPTPTGGTVYVRDVANVQDTVAESSTFSRISIGGSPSQTALTLYVYKTSGGNVVQVAERVKERLDVLQKTTLADTQVLVSFDLGKEVRKDLYGLTKTGIETVILVMLSLFLTIGWRESLVAGVSIPLSFLIAFIGLNISGNTINFVSLFSLILAIGILIDAGIVVTEAIHTRLKKTGDPIQAAYGALEEYAWPLIAGTMTTVAVFVPLFFLSGVTGKFIASIPFTIIFVLIASIFVALGVVPLVAVMFTSSKQNALEKKQEEYNALFQAWYRRQLSALLDNNSLQKWFLVSMVAAFFISLSFPSLGLVKSVFFPKDEAAFVFVEIEKTEGTTLEATDLTVREVEEVLYENKDIESFVTTVGSGSSFSQNQSAGSKLANFTILIHEGVKSGQFVSDLRTTLHAVKNAEVRVSEPSDGPPSSAPIVVQFFGDNLAKLEEATLVAEKVLATVPGTQDIQSSTKGNGFGVTLEIDKAKATAAGLSPAYIAQVLRTSINGAKATSIKNGDTDIEVHVRLALNAGYKTPYDTADISADTLRTLPLQTRNGTVLLGSVLTTGLEPNAAAIRHLDRERLESVSSQVTSEANAIEVTAAFKDAMIGQVLPEGVRMKVGGEDEDVGKTFTEMFLALIAGISLMLAILVLEFNSFRYTFYLLSIIPLSVTGVMLGLMVSFQPLSFSAVLGIIALAGVIINHAIILMDSMLRFGSDESALTYKQVIIDAAASRLRPILLTTVTTVVGMIPLTYASALWGPLAFTIMFGLTYSTILTLILIPVLFYRYPGAYFKKLAEKSV
jgi:multidrug efflux pump